MKEEKSSPGSSQFRGWKCWAQALWKLQTLQKKISFYNCCKCRSKMPNLQEEFCKIQKQTRECDPNVEAIIVIAAIVGV